MRYLLVTACMALCFFSTSCMQTENSNSQDKSTWANEAGPFGQAKKIFATSCTPCHSFQAMTEDELVSSGRVVKGSPDSSILFKRCNGSVGPMMPPSGSLSTGDLDKLQAWILQMQ